MGTDGVTAKGARRPRLRRPQVAWARILVLGGLLGLAAWATQIGRAQAPAQVPPGAEIVADVLVQGNRTIPTDRIMRYIRLRHGNVFSYEALKEDAGRLNDTRWFRDVRPEKQVQRDPRTGETRVVVVFWVSEHPSVVQEVIYNNAHHISQKDLEDMTKVRKGQPLNPALNQRACFEIQDRLKKDGHYFATVSLEEGERAGDTRVVFNITEGPSVMVRSTNFHGQSELASGPRLRTQIDTSRAFFYVFGGKFNAFLVDNDVLKLEEYYRANGYLNARVTRELRFSPDKRWVDIDFHIHEGQRFNIKGVSVQGTRAFESAEVGSIVQVKAGDNYKEKDINSDVENIKNWYGYRGYPVQVTPQLTEVDPGVVRVQYQVQESKPFRVGQVIIVGNEVTEDRVIRRVLGIIPGQILQFPEIRRAEANLARLNLFEIKPEEGIRPNITVIDGPPGSEYKDLLVNVKETRTGSLLLGGGLNSDSGFFGSIVLNERNFSLFRLPGSFEDILEGRAFRGAGQEFRIEAVPGTQLQRYSVSFREPYLFDLPYSLTVGGFYWDRVFDEYTEGRYGGRFTLGHQLTRSISASVGFRIENINVSNVGFGAPVDYTSVEGNNFQIVPRFAVTYDTRDSVLRPTQGGMLEAAYEQGLGDLTFPIVTIEGSQYFTAAERRDGSGKQVVALRSTLAWAGENTPVYERFFAGGYRSLRGFQFRGVGPFTNGFNTGGDLMILNSIEYQIPVIANDNFHFVTFVDSGTVERNFEITDYRVTAGFGMRVTIPAMGPVPIAFDFGFPIVRGPNDREQVFSFWIGLFR